MAKTNVVYENNADLIIREVEYVDKVTKETKTFNTYHIEVDGQEFRINIDRADKKLFDYVLGL